LKLPANPREARPAPAAVNVLKTLVQIVFMWGFFLFVCPFVIVRMEAFLGIPHFNLPPWIGIAVFVPISLVGFYSAMLFAVRGRGTPFPLDTAIELVILGPYRYIRNPMAVAGIGQGIGVGLYLNSPATLVYSLCGAFAWHYIARPWEEADLVRRFGKSYENYRQAVPLWRPRLRPYRAVSSPDS